VLAMEAEIKPGEATVIASDYITKEVY